MSSDSEYSSSSSSDSSDVESEDDGFEYCCAGGACRVAKNSRLPFDPSAIQEIILQISDHFDFRVVMSDGRVKTAIMITTGLTIAGSMVGKHYGGKLGAALGGAVGGACGVGIASVTLRDVWEDVKSRLAELYDIVYDYLAGLNLADYEAAANFLMQDSDISSQLARTLLSTASALLKKKVTSSLTQ